MKTNDVYIVIATAAYSYLFYQQGPGINCMLFNLLIVLLLFLKDKSLLSQRAWLAAATGSLVSSFFVFWWGTPLTVMANFCSFGLLAGFSFSPQSSLLFAAANAGISVLISIPRLFQSVVDVRQPQTQQPGILKKILLLTLPAAVTLVFVVIYRAANPIFAKFVDQINFDFISFSWIVFTAVGFFIMFGLFNIYMVKINERDKNASDTLPLITAEQHALSASGSLLSVPNELLVGISLFAMLNMVLLTVNGLNVFYMWVLNTLPAGITIAQFLHDGTNALILSILLAIAILLFVFRGFLNFIENNKWLKLLAYAWIAQNVILIITTANTNWWIIQSTGLTRRRIGVYVYLLLCIIGLITTFIKVAQKKSNWFLFRKNAWAFYTVFIISCFINWDGLIVNYNCKNYKELELGYIDRGYQARLSHTCLATLFKYYAAEKKEGNSAHQIFSDVVVRSMWASYNNLKTKTQAHGWQSFCYSRNQNLREIDEMIESGELHPQ